MFGTNRAFLNKVDELEKRNVELARQTKELYDENKELREIRRQTEHNNTIILKRNTELENAIKEITNLCEINTYGNEKAILNKIKELARPLIKPTQKMHK